MKIRPRLLAACLAAAALLPGGLRAEPVVAMSGVFAVDRTPPALPVALEPADGAAVVSPFLRLRARSADNLSGVAGYEFELVGAGLADRDADFAVFRGVPDGEHLWRVRARDAAGNRSGWAEFSCRFEHGDDDDGDGLPDTWELLSFGRLDFSDGTADSNLDGRTDLENAEAGRHGFEFHLDLEAGWNMVALPCDTDLESAAALAAAASGPIWMWDAEALRYVATDAPPARRGLWIHAAERAENVPVSGHPPDGDLLDLPAGWNLAGSGLPAALEDMDGIRDIMAWIDGAYDLIATEVFHFSHLQGYWLHNAVPGPRRLLAE